MQEMKFATALIALFTTLFLLTLNVDNPCLAQDNGEDVVIGKYCKVESKILGEEQTYLVHLPSGYESSQERYPVVYCMNGTMLSNFAVSTATLDRLGFELIPQMILIGIDSSRAGVIPCRDQEKVDKLVSYIQEELVPHIDKNYRTENYRILFGQSNTALFSIYLMLSRPDAFDAVIAASPSFNWCSEFINEKAERLFAERGSLKKFLYIPFGGRDYKELVVDSIPPFVEVLKAKAPADLHWQVELLENDGHVPIASLNNGLLELFPDFLASDELRAQGIEALDAHYLELTRRYGFEISTPEEAIFDFAYQFRRQQKFAEMVPIFKELLRRYPGSWRSNFFLAEAYQNTGEKELALEFYRKTLEIRPDFNTAKQRIEALEKEK